MAGELTHDFIIAGQGLAGSLLAFFLEEQGKKVIVIDPGNPSSSSRIAAGIIHPITGRRIVKSWMANDLIPFAEKTYRAISDYAGTDFYIPKNILEIYTSLKHRNDWLARSAEPGMEQYLGKEFLGNSCPGVLFPFGGMEVTGSGFLLIQSFLEHYRNHLIKNNSLLDETIDYHQIQTDGHVVLYKDYRATGLICCEGAAARMNPYFSGLPFAPAKGEILTIHMEGLENTHILNKGIYLLPLGNAIYKAGATHEWDFPNTEPTASGLDKLTRLIKTILNNPFEIISHQASIRPTVKDRRPFLGTHSKHPCLHIFNGLGTKGVMLGPWFANAMMEYLIYGKDLPKEVNINRFE